MIVVPSSLAASVAGSLAQMLTKPKKKEEDKAESSVAVKEAQETIESRHIDTEV